MMPEPVRGLSVGEEVLVRWDGSVIRQRIGRLLPANPAWRLPERVQLVPSYRIVSVETVWRPGEQEPEKAPPLSLRIDPRDVGKRHRHRYSFGRVR